MRIMTSALAVAALLGYACGTGLTEEQRQRIADVCEDPSCQYPNSHCRSLVTWEENGGRCFEQVLNEFICGAKYECMGFSANDAHAECWREERALELCQHGYTCPGDPECLE